MVESLASIHDIMSAASYCDWSYIQRSSVKKFLS